MHKFKKESIIAPFFYLQHLFLLHISIITLTIINISKVAKNRTIAPVPKNVTSSVKFPINNPATNPIKIAIINFIMHTPFKLTLDEIISNNKPHLW